MDAAWWRHHWDEVRETFAGQSYSTSSGAPDGVDKAPVDHFQNSGAGAIALAEWFGAEHIVLLGYDCHKRGGAHWHGNHPKGLGNAGSMPQWPAQFARLARSLSGTEIVNCSPGTALRAFRTQDLEEALEALRRIESAELRSEAAQAGHLAA